MNGYFTADQARHMTMDELTYYIDLGCIKGDSDALARALTFRAIAESFDKSAQASLDIENLRGEVQIMEERWHETGNRLEQMTDNVKLQKTALRKLLAEALKAVDGIVDNLTS